MNEWITVKEAAGILKCSDRHVRNMAATGKLKARREGNRWFIHSSLTESAMESERHPKESDDLRTENQWLKERIVSLERQLESVNEALSEASNRHDTIVLQLTKQLEQSQRLLEYHKESWWRRIFKKESKDI